ncbi:hypothetical protein HGB24_02795, partial [Candidatus Saccharibacteria bacterium]|nr:hypothetical protein [Candidatus Saccharibacteria bacterium]
LAGDQGIDYTKIKKYVAKLVDLSKDYHLVLVSSGAVAAGRSLSSGKVYSDNSLLAMLGSAEIVTVWQKALGFHGLSAGQILVTYRDIDDQVEGGRLRKIIELAISNDVIPIINENDVLSDIELARLSYGGDNDGLAAKIAVTIQAKHLLLLTNVDGLLDGNNQVIKRLDEKYYDEARKISTGKSELGRGGMVTKLDGAILARNNRIDAIIGNSSANYHDLIDGKCGTHFV